MVMHASVLDALFGSKGLKQSCFQQCVRFIASKTWSQNLADSFLRQRQLGLRIEGAHDNGAQCEVNSVIHFIAIAVTTAGTQIPMEQLASSCCQYPTHTYL